MLGGLEFHDVLACLGRLPGLDARPTTGGLPTPGSFYARGSFSYCGPFLTSAGLDACGFFRVSLQSNGGHLAPGSLTLHGVVVIGGARRSYGSLIKHGPFSKDVGLSQYNTLFHHGRLVPYGALSRHGYLIMRGARSQHGRLVMQGTLSTPGGHRCYGARVKGAVSYLLAHFALFEVYRVLVRVIVMVA
jgi:hypothetical protein